jgi:hypothetical protein
MQEYEFATIVADAAVWDDFNMQGAFNNFLLQPQCNISLLTGAI